MASFKKTVLFVEFSFMFSKLSLNLTNAVAFLFLCFCFLLLDECKHFSFINSLQSIE